MNLNPSTIMALPLVVYGTAYGCAWCWAKFRGWELTPQLVELSLAITIFYTVLDFLLLGVKKYAKTKTSQIEDEEVRRRKRENIVMGFFMLPLIMAVVVGWIIIHTTSIIDTVVCVFAVVFSCWLGYIVVGDTSKKQNKEEK